MEGRNNHANVPHHLQEDPELGWWLAGVVVIREVLALLDVEDVVARAHPPKGAPDFTTSIAFSES